MQQTLHQILVVSWPGVITGNDVSLFRVKFHWYLCNEVHVSVVLSLNELFYDIRIIFNVLASDGNSTVRAQQCSHNQNFKQNWKSEQDEVFKALSVLIKYA